MICTQNKYALISIAPTWFQDEGGHDRVCGTRQIQKHTDPQFESVAVSNFGTFFHAGLSAKASVASHGSCVPATLESEA